MKNLSLLLFVFFLTSTLHAKSFDIHRYKIDEEAENKDFQVESLSGKKASIRAYQSTKSETFQASIQSVLKGIENFSDKCNNEYKKRRLWTDQKFDCPIFNNNLVESKKIELDSKKFPLAPHQIRQYLIQRNIYNRESFRHYDLIEVFQSKNKLGQKVITLKQRMLTNNEVKNYLTEPFERETVFLETYGEFILTEISKNETKLDYRYYTETDHWLLNKSVATSEVFESTAKGLENLFKGIRQVIASSQAL